MKLTRFELLAWIPAMFATAAAAQVPSFGTVRQSDLPQYKPKNSIPVTTIDTVTKKAKPKNGRCPSCGTMAAPFEPSLEAWRSISPCAPNRVEFGTVNSICRQWDKSDLPKSELIRCSFCSNAFYQDAK